MYSRLGQGVSSSTQRAYFLAETVCTRSSVNNDQIMIDLPEALASFSDASVVEGHTITDLNYLIAHACR
jgi:hypothetical protein